MYGPRPTFFEVNVVDNFDHYGQPYNVGRFPTFREAEAKAHSVIDECLRQLHEPGDSAETLKMRYSIYGEVPMIFGPVPAGFKDSNYAYNYAHSRIAEIASYREH